jgi:hypothetical protein
VTSKYAIHITLSDEGELYDVRLVEPDGNTLSYVVDEFESVEDVLGVTAEDIVEHHRAHRKA